MPLPKAISKDTTKPSKAQLVEVDTFLENHYEYRCKPKYKGFFGKIRAYFDRCEEERREEFEKRIDRNWPVFYSDPNSEAFEEKPSFRAKLEDTFSITLLKLITTKGRDPVDVYKRANLDRKLFSKIRSQEDYKPSKNTVISLALALELSFDETQGLLKKAGFTLSRSILFDVIIEYFILQGNYDIFEINSHLLTYKQPLLL